MNNPAYVSFVIFYWRCSSFVDRHFLIYVLKPWAIRNWLFEI